MDTKLAYIVVVLAIIICLLAVVMVSHQNETPAIIHLHVYIHDESSDDGAKPDMNLTPHTYSTLTFFTSTLESIGSLKIAF